MGKSCLSKLSDNIAVGCTIPQVGVKEIYLMHTDDVVFGYNIILKRIDSVKFAEDAKSYKIEGYRQNIQVNGSLKSLDASATMDASVAFKIPFSEAVTNFVNTITTGKFHVLVVYNSGEHVILGSTVPLECSAAEFDSNANATMITLTLSTPEGSAGCPMVVPHKSVSDIIIYKAA